MATAKKPIVFISHVHEDREVAVMLSSHIERAFLGALDVFVSSDGSSIRGGDKWMQKVEDSLRSSHIVLVIISRHSAARKWLYFEVGGAFFLGARVVPLLDGSVSLNELGPPLNYLQVCLLRDPIHLQHIFSLLAEVAGMKVPQVDFQSMTQELAGTDTSRQHREIPAESPNGVPVGVTQNVETVDEGTMLYRSAKEQVQRIFTITVRKFKNSTGNEYERALKELNLLLDKQLIKGNPPEFLMAQYRDLCIANEKLYLTDDMLDVAKGLLENPETPAEQKVELVQWIGRLFVE